MSVMGTVYDLDRQKALGADSETLLVENKKLREALANIADGIIPTEVRSEWMGLSEEAWFEQRGDYFQGIARDALGRKE